MKLAFEKWEGLGNDFVVFDHASIEAALAGVELSDALVKHVCDRRRGVGADGILIVDRASSPPRMVVRNADGSRPEMCGNGLRCVAGYLTEGAGGTSLAVTTDAGVLGCKVEPRPSGEVDVEIAMGKARFEGDLEVDTRAGHRRFDRVSMGNPHAITFEPHDDPTIEAISPFIEHAVPGGTNVEFVKSEGDAFDVRVWERGVGFTLACGTGACAVAAAACKRGVAAFDRDLTVNLPGGALRVRVASSSFEVTMRGPARRVFRGHLELG